MYGLAVDNDKKIDSQKNSFRGDIKITLFFLHDRNKVDKIISGKGSGDLSQNEPLENFVQKTELKAVLTENSLRLFFDESYWNPIVVSDASKEEKLAVVNNDELGFFISRFKTADRFCYLLPSLIKLSTEEKLYLEFCVYLAFEDDDKPESFEFLFVKENIFFFPESRESTNGILVKPTFSNESELNIELIKENEIVGKSQSIILINFQNNKSISEK